VSFNAIDIKYNPDDLEPKISEDFFNSFNPGFDTVDKNIYDRIYLREMDDYQEIKDIDPFGYLSSFIKKNLVENIAQIARQNNSKVIS